MKTLGFLTSCGQSWWAVALLVVLAGAPLATNAFTPPVDVNSNAEPVDDNGHHLLNPGTYPSNTSAFAHLRFLNATTVTQQKTGSLIIGSTGGDAGVCLNTPESPPSPVNLGDADAATCVHSWADVLGVSALTGLPLGSLATGAGASLADYTKTARNIGFSRLTNDVSKNQQYGLIVQANTNPSLTARSRAVYAADAPANTPSIGTNWAAYFLGNVAVTNRTWSSSKSFCLNGMYAATNGSSAGCVTRWTDPFFSPTGNGYIALSPMSVQPGGQAGIVAVTGATQVGTMQAGDAAGAPLSATCGNGICNGDSSPAEDVGSCSIDCQTIGPSVNFHAYPGNGKNYLDFQGWNDANMRYVVILRQASSVSTATPVDGVVYAAGDVVGDAVVVYANQIDSQPITGLLDSGLQNGTTYYYSMFSGNDFPRFGNALTASATPQLPTLPLTITIASPSRGAISVSVPYDADLGGSCSTTCTMYFMPGTQLDLKNDAAQSGYSFKGFGGSPCNGAAECSFVITTPVDLNTTFSKTH